ncbi:MAG: ferritin-like domain-containing protein [Bacteroidetes bacterium]|nr:ferritin-like domain-containing protein [Bacteroidota bacterium]
MKTSQQWIDYFTVNLQQQRINWMQQPVITENELRPVLRSLQAWQLGETSDGLHLIAASKKYALKINDPLYEEAVKLFIKEEQKHGNNLGRYLDAIGKPRIQKDWGDTMFRTIRGLNTSMEWWTLAVITVESAAQIFYQSLKDATGCPLLKAICTDILIDEAPHIQFQQQRLAVILNSKKPLAQSLTLIFYKFFFASTTLVVWMGHRKLFKAGGNSLRRYLHKMRIKMNKTIGRLHIDNDSDTNNLSVQVTI